ncbi:autotransporter adhesin domain protein, partial [Acinetobacter baumannii 1096934]
LNTKIDNTKTELENKGLNFAGNSGQMSTVNLVRSSIL